MTDLESQSGVVRLFLTHALIREIGFVFYAGFPETLAQWNDADFAFVIGGVGEGWASVLWVLLRSLVSKPSNVAVTVALGSGSPLKRTRTLKRSPTWTLAGLSKGTIPDVGRLAW